MSFSPKLYFYAGDPDFEELRKEFAAWIVDKKMDHVATVDSKLYSIGRSFGRFIAKARPDLAKKVARDPDVYTEAASDWITTQQKK